eukprot:5978096-Prymnesium_polylepis.1
MTNGWMISASTGSAARVRRCRPAIPAKTRGPVRGAALTCCVRGVGKELPRLAWGVAVPSKEPQLREHDADGHEAPEEDRVTVFEGFDRIALVGEPRGRQSVPEPKEGHDQ